MIRKIKRIYNPAVFQGSLRRKRYFEGWYFKMISDDDYRFAIIPGISITGRDNPSNHSFIQVIYGDPLKTRYLTFPLKDFKYRTGDFAISIRKNHFNLRGMDIDIKEEDISISGDISFSCLTRVPRSLINPGIMGWYSFVPFMECYHGIVSMNHQLRGILRINKETVDFNMGRGYIEKDWGRSFPRSYIWMQSNHFSDNETSFMLSVADIPWLGNFFIGFLSVLKVGNTFYRFTSYTKARIELLEIDDENVHVEIRDTTHTLIVRAEKRNRGSLAAPVTGNMQRIIKESLDSQVNVILILNKDNSILFDGKGIHAGMEIAGDKERLIQNYR